MTVLGIDLSTHAIDLVYLDEDTLRGDWDRITLPRTTRLAPAAQRGEQIAHINDHFPTLNTLEAAGVWLAGIEDPHGRHAHTAKALGEITGAVKLLLTRRDIPHIPIPPAEWKRELGLPGNATKDQVRDRIAGGYHWPQDAFDAYAIALAALRINERAQAA